MSCRRCMARHDPAMWFKEVLPADLKAGVAPEFNDCNECGSQLPAFGKEKFIERNKLFSRWLQVHHRELPSWVIPCQVAVLLSHGQTVDNYVRFLAWGE